MAYNPNFNPNCGACGGLNSRGYCNYTACRFPQVTSGTVITVNPPIYVDDTPKLVTNADKLRAMSDEELAEWYYENASCPPGRGYPDCGVTPYNEMDNCKKCWLDWLRQEAPGA